MSRLLKIFKKYDYIRINQRNNPWTRAEFTKSINHRYDARKEIYKVGEDLKRIGFTMLSRSWFYESVRIKAVVEDGESPKIIVSGMSRAI